MSTTSDEKTPEQHLKEGKDRFQAVVAVLMNLMGIALTHRDEMLRVEVITRTLLCQILPMDPKLVVLAIDMARDTLTALIADQQEQADAQEILKSFDVTGIKPN